MAGPDAGGGTSGGSSITGSTGATGSTKIASLSTSIDSLVQIP